MNRKEDKDRFNDLAEKMQQGMVGEYLMERALMHAIMPAKEFETYIAKKERQLLDSLYSAFSENVALFDVLSPAIMMSCITRGVIITVKLNDINEWEEKKEQIEKKLEPMFKSVNNNWSDLVRKGHAPPRTKTEKAHTIHID